MSSPESTIGQKVKREIGELIPVTLFFLITFQLLALTQTLMLTKHGISTSSFLNAAVAALVVAKVVLIADHFRAVNRFPDRPLIYNVAWKTAIYFTASFLVRYFEHVFKFWRKSADLSEAHQKMFAEIVWPHFWCVQMWLFILLLLYCTVREMLRALGRERVLRLFFRDAGGVRAQIDARFSADRE